MISLVSSNYEVSITNPLVFKDYASFSGEISTVTFSDDSPATQIVNISIFNPCFASTFDAATVFVSPALDLEVGYFAYLNDPATTTINAGDY